MVLVTDAAGVVSSVAPTVVAVVKEVTTDFTGTTLMTSLDGFIDSMSAFVDILNAIGSVHPYLQGLCHYLEGCLKHRPTAVTFSSGNICIPLCLPSSEEHQAER